MKQFLILIAALCMGIMAGAQEKPEGLFINSKAPDFKANDQNGNEVSLKDLRKKGQVVLVFYRGNWCPYCSRQLKKLQDSLQLIRDKGAELVAITPEMSDGISKTVEKTGAEFSIIYDDGLKIMQAYDVDYALDEKAVSRYKTGGIDLEEINQKNRYQYLPVPAVFIISSEGSITYRFFDPNYKKRVSVQEILNNL